MAKKINSDVMKQNNRNEVLRLIRKGPRSRIKLAEKTGLTRAAISFITEELLAEGLIVEGEKSPSIGGRPATLLQINGDYGVYGGVHFTRNEYAVGVCDFTGQLLKAERGRVEANDAKGSLLKMRESLEKCLIGQRRLLGIGITAPGPLSREEGRLGEVANFAAWKNMPVCAYFEKAFGVGCTLDNVSNALAYAEYSVNADCARKYLTLIVDSGFGSAVAEKENGVRLTACELGHTTVDMHGARCDCGNIGCAELYVNEQNFHGTAEEQASFYNALASVIVNATNGYSVEQVIFSGVVTADFTAFSARLQEELARRGRGEVRLLPSLLGGREVFVACNLCI